MSALNIVVTPDESPDFDVASVPTHSDLSISGGFSPEATDRPEVSTSSLTERLFADLLAGTMVLTSMTGIGTMPASHILPPQPSYANAHQTLNHRVEKRRLIQLLRDLDLMFSGGDADPISFRSLDTAKRLIERIPDDVMLPRVAPDGEGGLTLSWTQQQAPVLVSVDESDVHLIINPGTIEAVYMDDIEFDDAFVPALLLSWIERTA